MNPDFGKNSYESIPIPEKLNEIVAQTIASRNKEEIYMSYENTNTTDKTKTSHPVWKGCMAAAAAFLVAGTIGLNVSPAFAEEMAKIPAIGQLAQVLTFRSFEGTIDDVELNVNVPVIRGFEGEIPAKVNAQIQQLTAEYETQAKNDLAEYKESFFAAGGTEKEWANRTMSLFIDYDVRYFEDNILSLQVTTAKSWVSAEEEYHFYNIDLKQDTELTLEDVLGKNYAEICNTSIFKQINERMASDENAVFFGFGNDEGMMDGFTTVDETTAFYLNENGSVVISFPEYSIAPGSMGIQEFLIS